ncbi:MAG: iron-sulfur cluster assembly accessory protein [Thiotrichaceae bacterium]
MITVTDAAKDQIEKSRAETNTPDLPLRIAIQVQQEGGFHYQMGFDDNITAEDTKVEGTNIILDEGTQPVADGMTLDFVDIEGKKEFIFLNPNDPTYKAPTE